MDTSAQRVSFTLKIVPSIFGGFSSSNSTFVVSWKI